MNVINRIKQASATTAYYDNSTLAFRPIIQLLHDVELNPGPANCSTTNEFKEFKKSTHRLAQLVERRTTEREVSGSSPRLDQHSGS